ncbi:MAG: LUD domain-containing protein, partial [Dehalococcoidia bacterium]|nr:LUD domain-containing protein [Dehalococcoidia bacterium]
MSQITQATVIPPEDMYARRLANKEGIKRKHLQQLAQAVVKPLTKNGFTPIYVEDRERARGALLDLVPETATVGVGGSMTIREIGVLEELASRGHVIYNHWRPGLSQQEILDIRH